MAPTIGQIVYYHVTERDLESIRSQHHSNGAMRTGEAFPAVVVRVHSPFSPQPTVNLKVLLDGNDDYWATNRHEGRGPGKWSRS